jgi:hypothetical protein
VADARIAGALVAPSDGDTVAVRGQAQGVGVGDADGLAQVGSPRDPYGQPWSLALQEQNPSRTAFEMIEMGQPSEAGAWRSKDLPWGAYVLFVEDSVGDRWLREEVVLEGAEARVDVSLAGVLVDGRISLDGEPLEAEIYFGGRHGERRIHWQSDAEGRFGGYLPEAGDWPVFVEAREPRVSRQIRAVPVETMGMGDAADVRIDLPATLLRGRIADDQGRPAAGTVMVLAGEIRQRADQVRADEDGTFEIQGLEPGSYVLQALGSGGTGSSQPAEVEVPEEGETPEVELRLRRNRVVEGIVRGPSYPVPGAYLLASARGVEGGPTAQLLLRATTDVQGKYALTVPADAEALDLVVLPPGFALTTLRMSLPEQPALHREDVHVHDAGGSLKLRVDEPLEGWDGFVVSRDGIDIGYPALLQWARLQGGGPAADTVHIPRLSFVEYRACLFRDGQNKGCRAGFLPPGGDLELELED